MRLKHLGIVAALAAGLVIGACGGSSGTEPAAAPTEDALGRPAAAAKVASVTLPATSTSVIGTPLQLNAEVRDKAGRILAGVTLAWASADTGIATVSSSGLVTPLRAGSTSITARSGTVTGTTLLTMRSTTPAPAQRSANVGTNLAGIAYWTTEFPFVNLMKNGGTWSSREDPGTGGAPLLMTAEGYPASLAAGQHAVMPVAWQDTHYPTGRYVVLWDGEGGVSVPMSNATVVESSANRIAVDVPSNLGSALWVSIDRTNPANPVRNLRFLLPGTEATYATQPFNPRFLEKVGRFSNLRFMDWGATNGSPVVDWADRSHVSDAIWSKANGVPLEAMIDLANTLHVDPWFCIPHRASDDYVTQLATLLKGRLDPSLRAHIEYSNEVWNTGFAQTQWAAAESDRLGLPRPYGMPSAFYAQRAVQIFKLMRNVFGAADSARLVRVIGGQAVWTQFQDSALGWADTAANADALAIAPYFNAAAANDPTNVDATLALTSDQVIDQMLASIRGQAKDAIVQNAALARRHGLRLKGYEGGPHDTNWNFPANRIDAMSALFASAHRHPRMRAVVTEYYDLWAANGGEVLNQYVDIGAWSKWGYWGSLEYATQDAASAPKYQGLMDAIAARPLP